MKYAVAGIVIINGQILIGKKKLKEGHFVSGGWHIPGGNVNEGETQEDAIAREYKEETDLSISIVRKLCKHYVKETDTELTWFICSSNTDNAKPMDDLTDIKFVNPNNILTECDLRATRLWPNKVLDYLLNL